MIITGTATAATIILIKIPMLKSKEKYKLDRKNTMYFILENWFNLMHHNFHYNYEIKMEILFETQWVLE